MTLTPTMSGNPLTSTTAGVPTIFPSSTAELSVTSPESSPLPGAADHGQANDQGLLAFVSFMLGMLLSAVIMLAAFVVLLLTGKITRKATSVHSHMSSKEPPST